MSAAPWKVGTDAGGTIYTFEPNFNTLELGALLGHQGSGGDVSDDVEFVDLMLEIQINDGGLITSTKTINARVYNDVIKGDEGDPVSGNPDYPPASELEAVIAHVGNTDNPHVVTQSHVGLSNVDNTSDAAKPVSTATQIVLDDKVTKMTGYGLSKEDFTTSLKMKLEDIEAAAERNTVDSVNGKTGVVVLKGGDIMHTTYPDSISDVLDNKVYKVTGKDLSANDFTDSLKAKLDNIEDTAERNAVTSVNTKVGAVVLAKADVGLGDVDNTSDATKAVAGNPVGDAIIAEKLKVVSNSSTAVYHDEIGSLSIKTYTLDVDLRVDVNNSISLADKLVVGDIIAIKNNGDFKITITPSTGVTIDAVDNDLTLYDKYEVRVLVYEGSDHWTLI